MKIKRIGIVLFVLSMLILSACTNEATPSEDERTLTVGILYDYDEQLYMSMYSSLFAVKYPHIKVEYISAHYDPNNIFLRDNQIDSYELMKTLMEDAKPDIVMLNYSDYLKLQEDQHLVALDDFMKNAGMSDDEFIHSMIAALRSSSDDRIYGLSPMIASSYALIYNKDIFSAAGLNPPADGMTWSEVFELAREVQNEEQSIYGFSFEAMNPFSLDSISNLMTRPSPLQQLQAHDYQQMMVNSDQWRNVLEQLKQLRDENVVPGNLTFDPMNRAASAPFLTGKLAMGIISHGIVIDDLLQLTQNPSIIEGFEPIAWDLVTLPVHEDTPEQSPSIEYGPIMAINANAQNVEDAWEFIAFVHGDEWNRVRPAIMSTRQDRAAQNDEVNMEAFYKLRPLSNPSSISSFALFRDDAVWTGDQLFRTYLDGQMSLDQMLEEWETEGNRILNTANND